MLTGKNKSKIDKIWDAFWSGGISDPLRVIEQISFLLFIKRLDDLHTAREKQANRLGKPSKEPIFAAGQDHLRWSRFREFEAKEMFRVVSQEVFPLHQKPARRAGYASYGFSAMIVKPYHLAEMAQTLSRLQKEKTHL